ncbi:MULTISPECIES: DUF6752 domain-containing protein [unclassified Nocardioides]|uniref:DUF6752 domain-containing protein n=1 Tax=unclassified Nocardioides TaxID=2615069 RepID=UPI001E2A1C5E|nr:MULTISPECIES: DUF6752 domain-containing protein [unclassified Nocardioides]MCD4525369.1 hypothetical protein [Nocardioides sp. cx-173]MCD4534164.1 hypothetical protein [Nocardioides sp. cx-169]UGB40835.1 hypothetical protein LQ940_15815 [Nocardioides sp. cx-173]
MGLKQIVRQVRDQRDLVARVEHLEQDLLEMRRHQLRLAELADVVQELLVPMASRDQDRIDVALAKFTESI